MFIFRATVSAVSCMVVPVFICIDLLISCALKLNDDDDDDDDIVVAFVSDLGTGRAMAVVRSVRTSRRKC